MRGPSAFLGRRPRLLEDDGTVLATVRGMGVDFFGTQETVPVAAAARQAVAGDEPNRVAELRNSLETKDRELRELVATYRLDVNQAIEEAKARLERYAENQLQIDRARLVEDLLPVLDNLSLARTAATRQRADHALVDGIVLVERQFLEKLEAFGVRRFDSVGTRFDPKLHQAAGTVPAPDMASEGVVLVELHPGYSLGDRLLRPAIVLVGRE